MKTVAYLHGWASGNWLVKDLLKEFETVDLKFIKNAKAADIIVAHSAGCYRIPKNAKAQLIMLVGLPYWPEIPLHKRLANNRRYSFPKIIARSGRLGFYKILFRRTMNTLLHPSITYFALAHHKKLDVLDQNKNRKMILVRNRDDAFCSPRIKSIIANYPNIKYVEMPGGHDNYQENPKPYIDLLLMEL